MRSEDAVQAGGIGTALLPPGTLLWGGRLDRIPPGARVPGYAVDRGRPRLRSAGEAA